MLTLPLLYQKHITQQGFTIDPAQQDAINQLQHLYLDWLHYWQRTYLHKLLRRRQPRHAGFYLWGDVGCGKTMLLDLFYSHLPDQQLWRMHFHSFMQTVHQGLTELKNKREPLRRIARDIARQAQLLYLDEFQVHDIGDAMILAELLDALCANKTLILLSSNQKPGDLYRDGLQRARFLPTIALIEEKFQVVELISRCDYRLRYIRQNGLYQIPHDAAAETWLDKSFHKLSSGKIIHGQGLKINGRIIKTVAHCGHCAWFRFAELCATPRSATDYLEIARLFETVLLSEIPIMTGKDDILRRFINLIDAFYDCKVRLIASAATLAKSLYTGQGAPARDFKRTVSRLTEMQSDHYWHGHHAFNN